MGLYEILEPDDFTAAASKLLGQRAWNDLKEHLDFVLANTPETLKTVGIMAAAKGIRVKYEIDAERGVITYKEIK